MKQLQEKVKDIKAFVFDVDGVLTDGKVWAFESGEQTRNFLIKDGLAIEKALNKNYIVAIISGGNQVGVRKRLEFLKVPEIHLGVKNKVEILKSLVSKYNIRMGQVMYMGDDLPDYDVMNIVGIPACPSDAVEEIKSISVFISDKNGGEGCVRDIVEKIMKAQNNWDISSQKSINN
jgi:3-deoxy-D-manno-octulosonate 8-phosphate phosphatase (KDO 8-P phosphatase)